MYPQETNDSSLCTYYADVLPLLDRTDLREMHTMNIGNAASTVTSLVNLFSGSVS
ncbi:MAG TPA: hypothetical protein VKM55_06540 [Candidatus Lokiarchaeia archaeon]|nr:hypothetical protein [Candidatus Lokiarchaeia archaeon]